MRYTGFTILNFKGIKSAKIGLSKNSSARIFTLVGLNEGGKTTVLEAIHAFKPDLDSGTVVGTEANTYKWLRNSVPRSNISDFTGKVSVKAEIIMDAKDVAEVQKAFNQAGLKIDPETLRNEFWFERSCTFEGGDFKGNFYDTSHKIMVKSPRQKNYRSLIKEERDIYRDVINSLLPNIAYFPTFVFDFPDRIYLSGRDSDEKNGFYRRLFQDILDYGGRGHKIDEHIVNRIRKPEFKLPFSEFIKPWQDAHERRQIEQVMDHAAQTVTKVIYEKWNAIFGEEVGKKEVIISWSEDEGIKKKSPTGLEVPADEHDIFVNFKIKDGADRFEIATRSLGFRWFFSFLLFTQFRAGRSSQKPLVFLLDEPASNLHASAQQKLIESFGEIAKEPHQLIYSTHSHYMIEPKWLEQAYIVQNESIKKSNNIIEDAIRSDSSIDIKVIPYRKFVSDSSNSTSYFQPIADRLNVVPSKIDINEDGIILEGKSDFYILSYFCQKFGKSLRFFPALGSGNMSPLISLFRGWGRPIRVILDSDKAGQKEAARYRELYILDEESVALLDKFFPGAGAIESLFSSEDLALMGGDRKLTKKEISAKFQESLASEERISLTQQTEDKFATAIDQMVLFLKRES